MSTQRPAIISRKTQEDIERTLDEVLNSVANGTIEPGDAKTGLLYLITSIDNGEPNEIATASRSSKLYKSVMSGRSSD